MRACSSRSSACWCALVGTDPVRIALGTAAVASVAHLDGAGASTFMVTVPAMLPLYTRAGMSPLALDLHHRRSPPAR